MTAGLRRYCHSGLEVPGGECEVADPQQAGAAAAAAGCALTKPSPAPGKLLATLLTKLTKILYPWKKPDSSAMKSSLAWLTYIPALSVMRSHSMCFYFAALV